ncbi:hypothetical protein ID866_12403 [Astraeus odoratus]|jgi:uncharacterized coiled-coil protein SlyX
MRVA